MTINRKAILAAATLAILTPAAASAQATANAADPAADPMMTTPMPVEDDRDEFPWGLLGLLGLAGLLGMKRRDDDVHVHRTGTDTRRP